MTDALRRAARRVAPAAAAVALAACGSVMPSEVPSPNGGSPSDSSDPTAAAPSSVGPTPAPTPRVGDMRLEVGTIDPAYTTPLLQVASDGDSIIFSSGAADGPDAEFAPDLYRYRLGDEPPQLIWRNPARDRDLLRIGGYDGVHAFVDASGTGERSWRLWLLPGDDADAVLLDEHPGNADVSSLVPSFSIHDQRIAWTAFDRGSDGPVSQLWLAEGPDWTPALLEERRAAVAELWLPHLSFGRLAYVEVVYSADRVTDERHVLLRDLATDDPPRRLDDNGRATMPLLVPDGVVWKETDAGFNMFNWGRMVSWDEVTGEIRHLSLAPQFNVNYPSAGGRFVAAWSADASVLAVHDLDLDRPRLVVRYEPSGAPSVVRPHLSGDLLTWVYVELGTDRPLEVRWAWLPVPGSDR